MQYLIIKYETCAITKIQMNMQYKFHAYGHQNILATHKTTLEFTKDHELSLKGDCIVGVNADFELDKLKKFIRKAKNKEIAIIIEAAGKKITDTIDAELNPDFGDEKEIVIRKTDFVSKRTLGIRSNKAAFDLNSDLKAYLKLKENKIEVILESD